VGCRLEWPGLQLSARCVLVSVEQGVRHALADRASTRVRRPERARAQITDKVEASGQQCTLAVQTGMWFDAHAAKRLTLMERCSRHRCTKICTLASHLEFLPRRFVASALLLDLEIHMTQRWWRWSEIEGIMSLTFEYRCKVSGGLDGTGFSQAWLHTVGVGRISSRLPENSERKMPHHLPHFREQGSCRDWVIL
jgi:hypothetical protein